MPQTTKLRGRAVAGVTRQRSVQCTCKPYPDVRFVRGDVVSVRAVHSGSSCVGMPSEDITTPFMADVERRRRGAAS